MNEIKKDKSNSKEHKWTLCNIETLYIARNTVTKSFDDYSSMVSEAQYKTIQAEGIKIPTLNQMLQRLTIALWQVKAGNTIEKLLNEIDKIV